ncbi:lactose-binding lectin l-2-like [Engraulis encrasicolus]|uniref:lactose-binding lectin l-2-like n=1 Tax=Engraulis encrasicolus TaxID=184585 RepID=UPI002FD57EC1
MWSLKCASAVAVILLSLVVVNDAKKTSKRPDQTTTAPSETSDVVDVAKKTPDHPDQTTVAPSKSNGALYEDHPVTTVASASHNQPNSSQAGVTGAVSEHAVELDEEEHIAEGTPTGNFPETSSFDPSIADGSDSGVEMAASSMSLGTPWANCPYRWTVYNSRCYRFFRIPKEWLHAEMQCVSHGGHLASVHNYVENFLVGWLSGGWSGVWIGATRNMGFGWSWTDGSPFSYRNWQRRQPNNLGGNQNCIHTNYRGAGFWNDAECHYSFPYVCVLD